MMHAFYKWERWNDATILRMGIIALCLYSPVDREYLVPERIVESDDHDTTCPRCLELIHA